MLTPMRTHDDDDEVQPSIDYYSNSQHYFYPQTPQSYPHASCYDYSNPYEVFYDFPQPIVVELANRPLWLKFAPHTLENIITKTGRRMFPTLEFKIFGLKPETTYNLFVEMVLVDSNHWKFNSGQWIPSGQIEQTEKTHQIFLHPDSPNSGAHWMRNEKISFSKLKLTNNKQISSNQQSTIILNSMHKYLPRLNVVELDGRSVEVSREVFTFPETQFIAVTAYQNTDVTQLKIDNNPFAKGFRDNAENRTIDPNVSSMCFAPIYPSSSYLSSEIDVDYYGNLYKRKRHH